MRDILTSPDSVKIKHSRRVYRLRLTILFFILFLSIVGTLAYFSADSSMSIDKITITGAHIISNKEIESTIYKKISGKYFYLFSRSNNFIYPKKEIYDSLISDYPRIKELSVYKDDMHTLHISIIERDGSYLYCGDTVPDISTDIGENCYFINNDGYIFDKAPYFSGNIYLKYYAPIPKPNSDLLGQYLMPSEKFHSLVRFIEGVENLGLKPIYLVIESDGLNSLYLNKKTGDIDHKIILNNDNDLSVIFDNFSASMKNKEFADEINSKYTTLQYIDLRFDNKVLYKFQ